MALIHLAHQIVQAHFSDKPKDIAIDATLGNGNDAAFLVQLGFKHVIGFDVQTQAIETSKQRIKPSANQQVELIHDSHHNLQVHIKKAVDCIMFNLGYLPKSDKRITTLAHSSVEAIELSLDALTKKGLLTVLCYPGHEQGKIETQAVQQLLNNKGGIMVDEHLASTPSAISPILYVVRKA